MVGGVERGGLKKEKKEGLLSVLKVEGRVDFAFDEGKKT